MKRFSILFAVAMLFGCSNEADTFNPGGEVDIPIDPLHRFIHFDADIASNADDTRGALVEGDILKDHFAVLGYQYPGFWSAEKVFATPNVFDKIPQEVRYENGIFTYGTPKVWTGNRYSFFAYYPSEHNAITLFDNGTAKQGDPYIIYTLPISSDPRDLIDVMTADHINTGVASSATVAMQFRHRLSAIDVGARNYYKYNHDKNAETPDKLVTIEIVNLEVNLTNVTSTSAKIYLDHTIPTVLNYVSPKASISYKMVDKDAEWTVSSFDVIPNTASDRAIRLVTTQSGENASSLLLLPQEEKLHGALKLTYKKKYQDDNGNWIYIHEGDNPNDFEFNPDLAINFTKQLLEGNRYYIELTFTSDAVSVNIIAADEWNGDRNGDGKVDDKDNIYHEFE